MTIGSPNMNTADQQLQRYRASFLQLLERPFESFANTVRHLLQACLDTLGVARVSVWTFDRGQTAIRLTQLLENVPDRTQSVAILHAADFPEYFAALRESLVLAAENAQLDPRTARLYEPYSKPMGIGSYLDTPIRSFGTHVGVLCIEHIGAPRAWHDTDQNFASAVATQISLAFEREDLRRTEAQLVRRTLYDPLTQLGNLVLLADSIEQSMLCLQPSQSLVLYWFDVEQFRALTYGVGLPLADTLLLAVVERLRQSCPSEGSLFRTGIDEFAALLKVEHGSDMEQFGANMLHSVDAPVQVGVRAFRISLAAGFCEYGPHSPHIDRDLMIRQAQSACAEARCSGALHRFAPADLELRKQASDLEQALRAAMERGALEPYFQPLLDWRDGRIVGFESLLRWPREDRMVMPDEFLPVALKRGLLVSIGRQTIARAFQCFAEVMLPSRSNLHLHINLAAPELLEPDLHAFLIRQMNRVGMQPRHLVVEVTETVLIEDLIAASRVIRNLRECGIEVYLDDFGTGYASLAYLRDMQFDGLKIDRSFIQEITSSKTSQAMLDAVTTLAQRLGCSVIAEGVENVEQLRHLDAFRIAIAQGYYFARAEPVSAWSEARMLALEARSTT